MAENLETLNKMCDELAEVRLERERLSRLDKTLMESEKTLKAKFITYLEEAELEQFRGTAGLVSIVNKFSVQTPKTEEQKKELFDFLTERNIFWQLVNVNSQTLNSFYKEELAAAQERGEMNFKLPGIDPPTLTQDISFRRK